MYSKEQGVVVQLFVTGHSQGAALAGVSLLDLLQDQQPQVYAVKGCLVVAAPKHGDRTYTDALNKAIAKNPIPFDLLANQDMRELPPFVAPSGHLWIVRVDQKMTGPATEQEKDQVINTNLETVVRRIFLTTPLHAIGGRIGYLHAMEIRNS